MDANRVYPCLIFFKIRPSLTTSDGGLKMELNIKTPNHTISNVLFSK